MLVHFILFFLFVSDHVQLPLLIDLCLPFLTAKGVKAQRIVWFQFLLEEWKLCSSLWNNNYKKQTIESNLLCVLAPFALPFGFKRMGIKKHSIEIKKPHSISETRSLIYLRDENYSVMFTVTFRPLYVEVIRPPERFDCSSPVVFSRWIWICAVPVTRLFSLFCSKEM